MLIAKVFYEIINISLLVLFAKIRWNNEQNKGKKEAEWKYEEKKENADLGK